MHYLHYFYAGSQFENASKELKEALTDFFGVLYLIHRGGKADLTVAKNRYEKWERKFGSCWPYANALHFDRVHGNEMKYSSKFKEYERHGCIGKFVQVFGCTIYPDQAYEAMIT